MLQDIPEERLAIASSYAHEVAATLLNIAEVAAQSVLGVGITQETFNIAERAMDAMREYTRVHEPDQWEKFSHEDKIARGLISAFRTYVESLEKLREEDSGR